MYSHVPLNKTAVLFASLLLFLSQKKKLKHKKMLPNEFISCWGQAECKVSPSTVAQRTTAAWRELVAVSAPLGEPGPSCGSGVRPCAHLSGTRRLNRKRSTGRRGGGIITSTSLTKVSEFRRAHPESSAGSGCRRLCGRLGKNIATT